MNGADSAVRFASLRFGSLRFASVCSVNGVLAYYIIVTLLAQKKKCSPPGILFGMGENTKTLIII